MDVEHADVDVSITNVTYNTVVNISCHSGYEMESDVTNITCTEHGNWTVQKSHCRGLYQIQNQNPTQLLVVQCEHKIRSLASYA